MMSGIPRSIIFVALFFVSTTSAIAASTYFVPVPEADADRLAAFTTMPLDANFRIRLSEDDAVLTYSIPNHLNGSESLGLKLNAPLLGRTAFAPGEKLTMTGRFDDQDDDPNTRAYAECTFEVEDRVSCAVSYSEIHLDAAAQLAWLQYQNLTPTEIAGFQEVAKILGHEALGIVRTSVQVRGRP